LQPDFEIGVANSCSEQLRERFDQALCLVRLQRRIEVDPQNA